MKKESYWFYGDKFDLIYNPRVLFLDKKNIVNSWKSHKLWNECSEEEQEKANLRQLAPYEFLIDIEDKKLFYDLVDGFKKFDCWSFETIRGGHIHLFCYKMLSSNKNEELAINENERKSIRKMFLSNLFNKLFIDLENFDISKIDFSKVDENSDVSREDKPHFKDLNFTKRFYHHSEGECLICWIMSKLWCYIPSYCRQDISPPSSLIHTSQFTTSLCCEVPTTNSEEGGVFFIKRSDKREKIENVLHDTHPKHKERVWLVGFLRYCGKTNEEICTIIHKNNKWTDYDSKITKQMVNSIKKK